MFVAFQSNPKQPKDIKTLLNELVKRINEDARRIRAVERRMDRLEGGLSSVESNVLTHLNDLKIELERISNKISAASERMNALEGEIMRLSKELGKTATKRQVKELESFIDLVNPITSKFVTRDEAERLLDERMKERVKKRI